MEIRQLMQAASPLLEALHDGVAVSDAVGVVVYVNQANTRITGLTPEQVLNRPVQEVVPDSHLLNALASGRELVGVRTRVAGREVVSNIVPLRDGERLIGAVSVFRDITEALALRDQLQEARNTIALLKDHLAAPPEAEGAVIGRNPAAVRAFTLAVRAASVTSPVLIEGESGTGKEVVARLIHARSDRAGKPFIVLNCAAVPATLLESELFGYDEGAFTGARRGGRAGLFEMADGGVLFLDEIGDMELAMQAKLLRAIQDGEFRRLGGGTVRRADVRILSATNRPLAEMVAAHQFREDLYYRLRVIRIHLPPLRERREDLAELIAHALKRAATRVGRPEAQLDQPALRMLMLYDYPGNIRELENLVEQAMVLDDDGLITEEDLPAELLTGRRGGVAPGQGGLGLPGDPGQAQPIRPVDAGRAHPAGFGPQAPIPSWEEAERVLLEVGLSQMPSRVALAAHLGISRATLYRKLAKYGLL